MTIPRRADGWFKTTKSPDNDSCIEVHLGTAIGVRDTKDRKGGELAVPAASWDAFLAGLKK